MTAPTVDLSGPARRAVAAQLVLPDRPECEWLAVLVPIPKADLDDFAVSPMQLAMDAGMAAQETARELVYAAVVERRRDARGAA